MNSALLLLSAQLAIPALLSPPASGGSVFVPIECRAAEARSDRRPSDAHRARACVHMCKASASATSKCGRRVSRIQRRCNEAHTNWEAAPGDDTARICSQACRSVDAAKLRHCHEGQLELSVCADAAQAAREGTMTERKSAALECHARCLDAEPKTAHECRDIGDDIGACLAAVQFARDKPDAAQLRHTCRQACEPLDAADECPRDPVVGAVLVTASRDGIEIVAPVEIDGTPQGHTPHDAEYPAGRHIVTVAGQSRPIELREGFHIPLHFEIPALPAASTEPWPWYLTGAGAAATIAGATLLWLGDRDEDEVLARPHSGERVDELLDDARAERAAGAWSLAIGGALIVGGLAWWLSTDAPPSTTNASGHMIGVHW